jgi:tricarballylate dehydrogenase
MTEDSTYDVVVIGMGAAAQSAAIGYSEAAAAQGRTGRVAVVERAPKEERGGATRYTSSWFRITEDRRLDPEFVPMMERVSGGRADLDYCRTLASKVNESLRFLDEHGVEVIYFMQPLPNRNTGGGLGMPAGGGISIVEGLAAVLEQTEGVEIMYETSATRLSQTDDGRVDGVFVTGPGGAERRLGAGSVVIACGGFEGSPELLNHYVGNRAGDMPVIAPGLRHNRGDGLQMAVAAGAATAGQFDMFHGEPIDPRSSKPDAVVYPYPYGIIVNGRAQRFFDEGQNSFDSTFERLGYEIWHDQDQTAFFIGDQTSLAVRAFNDVNLTDQEPVTAGTLRELAEQLGLDAEAFEQTVAEYNAAIAPGEFDPYVFDGKHTEGIEPPKSNWAFPIDSPPYIAYPLTCAVTFTFGGVRTDSSARVVRPDGTPIPGLYAAGEVTGLYYNEYPAGTSVLRSVTFGRIAGAHAAGDGGDS